MANFSDIILDNVLWNGAWSSGMLNMIRLSRLAYDSSLLKRPILSNFSFKFHIFNLTDFMSASIDLISVFMDLYFLFLGFL